MKAKDAQRYAERLLKELEHESRQIAIRRAFHRGQMSVFENYDVRDRTSSAPTPKEVRRKRVRHEKPRAGTLKARVFSYIEGRPGESVAIEEIAQALDANERTVRTYLCEFDRAGLVDFSGGVAKFVIASP